VRLPPAEFTYKPGANPDGSAADVPNFLLVEVLLPRPRPKAEKEAFWAEFRAAVEARLRSKRAFEKFAGICARPAEVESEHAYMKCPICGSDSVASGQTEFDTASDNDDEPRPVLTFFPDECIVVKFQQRYQRRNRN
jgi:hypothetical protein